MNYKALFQRLFLLISNPPKAWRKISKEETQQGVMTGFVYPLIGLCSTAVFLGLFIGSGFTRASLQPALMQTCCFCIALFGSFFLCAYLTDLLGRYYLKREPEVTLSRQLVGYSMSVIFVLYFFQGLFAEFIILKWLLQFYTLKIVWDGANVLMKVDEKKALTYTIMVTVIILFTPMLLQFIFEKLSLFTS